MVFTDESTGTDEWDFLPPARSGGLETPTSSRPSSFGTANTATGEFMGSDGGVMRQLILSFLDMYQEKMESDCVTPT
eukprot:scaffold4361_cov26-Attheya_sp.AAC.1